MAGMNLHEQMHMIWHDNELIYRNAWVMPGDIHNGLTDDAAIGRQRNFVCACHICGCVCPEEVFSGFCADGDEIGVWRAVVIFHQTVWFPFRQVHRYHLCHIVSLLNMDCNSKFKYGSSPLSGRNLGPPCRGVPSGARNVSGQSTRVLRYGPHRRAMRSPVTAQTRQLAGGQWPPLRRKGRFYHLTNHGAMRGGMRPHGDMCCFV